jgi:hypothetical protein
MIDSGVLRGAKILLWFSHRVLLSVVGGVQGDDYWPTDIK